MRKEYTSDTINQIWADVQKVQEDTTDRQLTREDVERALQTVEAQPYSKIEIDARCGGRKAPKNGGNTETIEDNSKYSAWNEVFPERAHAYESIMLKRRLIREGYVLPPDITDIYLYDEKYGMALISVRTAGENCSNRYLCSPLGYFKLDFYPIHVYKAVKGLGIRLPKDTKKRTWENIEPAWVMAQLRKL